jgi:hypothetical protein
MKRFILITFLFVLFTNGIAAATTGINLFGDPEPPGPKPLSLTYIPVSATISETDLSVYFEESVGTATITVYDASDQIVDQEVVNTNSTTEVFIPVDFWGSGAYTLKVTYGTTNLIGYFDIL